MIVEGKFQHYGYDIFIQDFQYKFTENVFLSPIMNLVYILLNDSVHTWENISLYTSFLFKKRINSYVMDVTKKHEFLRDNILLGYLWIKIYKTDSNTNNIKQMKNGCYFIIMCPLWTWLFCFGGDNALTWL